MINRKNSEFNINKQNRLSINSSGSTTKKNSSSKTARYGSLYSLHEPNINTPKKYQQKNNGNYPIKILLRNNSFIVEKKYFIYDIQCSLIKKQQRQPTIKKNEVISKNQNYLYLHLQTTSFSVTKGLVRQNFHLVQDSASFAEIKIGGYALLRVTIQNKKVQFVQLNGSQSIDDQDLTIIQPIMLIEEGEQLRTTKIKNCIKNKQGKARKKLLNFSWSLVSPTSHQNAQSSSKNSLKRNEPQWAQIFTLHHPNQNQPKINIKVNLVDRQKMLNDSTQTISSSRGQPIKLMDLLKKKQMHQISKTITKKSLNESGLSLSGLTKKSCKQNKTYEKFDSYGLQKIQIKKLTNKNQLPQSQLLHNHFNAI